MLHDLSLAAAWADRLILLHEGCVVAEGAPAEVLTPERISTVYGVRARVFNHPDTGRPLIAPQPFEDDSWSRHTA